MTTTKCNALLILRNNHQLQKENGNNKGEHHTAYLTAGKGQADDGFSPANDVKIRIIGHQNVVWGVTSLTLADLI